MRFFLAIKVLLFTLLVPGTVTIFLPYQLLTRSGDLPSIIGMPMAITGLIGWMLGASIYLRCTWDFAINGLGTPAPLDPPKTLVVSGLYRRTRNPMYLGVLLMLLAECALFVDLWLAAYAAVIGLMLHTLVVFYEEPILDNRFSQAYRHYCLAVPRWGWALQPYSLPAVKVDCV